LTIGLGATIELVLVLVATGARVPAKSSISLSVTEVAAAAVALILVLISLRTMEIVDGPPPFEASLSVCLAALMCPMGRLRPLGSALLMAIVASTVIPDLWESFVHPGDVRPEEMVDYAVALLSPLFVVAIASSSWPAWVHGFQRSTDRPLGTLVLLNCLNVADALLTGIGISRGVASEFNPVVDFIGLPLKIVLVAVASIAVYRMRPAWLPYPTAALLLVFGYHLSGLVING
jgi:hypothetical protein